MNTDPPATSYTLLARLCDPDTPDAVRKHALVQFVELYMRCVFRWAELRFGHERAKDVSQQIMVQIIDEPLRYAPRPGRRFSSWLRTIVRNRGIDDLRRDARLAPAGSGIVELAGPDARDPDPPDPHDLECEKLLYRDALAAVRAKGKVKEHTWRAFDRHVTEGRSVKAVAAELGVAERVVYVAKCRILKRVRDHLSRVAPTPEPT